MLSAKVRTDVAKLASTDDFTNRLLQAVQRNTNFDLRSLTSQLSMVLLLSYYLMKQEWQRKVPSRYLKDKPHVLLLVPNSAVLHHELASEIYVYCKDEFRWLDHCWKAVLGHCDCSEKWRLWVGDQGYDTEWSCALFALPAADIFQRHIDGQNLISSSFNINDIIESIYKNRLFLFKNYVSSYTC